MRTLFVVFLVFSHTLFLAGCATHFGRTGVSITIGPASVQRGETTIKSEVTEDLYQMVGVVIDAVIGVLRFVTPGGLQPAAASIAADDSVHHEHEPGVEVAPLMLYQGPASMVDNVTL